MSNPIPPRPQNESLAAIVSARLARLLASRSDALGRLSELTGIDAADLEKIETGAATPTIGDLWKIANALGVPFGRLVATKERQGVLVLRKGEPGRLQSSGGKFTSRALFPYDYQRPVEFYQVEIAPGHIERAEAHGPGARENLVVAKGSVEIVVGREAPVRLEEGDAIVFLADVPHSYGNPGDSPALLHLVMSYEAAS